ncbi:MAG: PKD domain-containing protein, partial [Bacteroidota bacterium]
NWYGTNATGGTASTTAPIPSTSTAGTTSYYVSQTIAGCEGPREVIIVTINPAPNVTVTNPAPVCSPLTVDITATAITTGSTTGLSYTYWTNASATSSYSTPAAATNGTYYIKGTTSFGCYDIKPVIVTVNPTPTINVDPASASICAGSTQILTASSTVTGTTYEWTGGSTLNPSSFSPTSTTNIYVTGTVNGCKNVSFSVVTVNPVPIVSILPTAPSICNGSTQLLTASSTLPGTTWLWSGGSTANPASFTPNTTTTISVVGTLNNCKDTAYTVITVNPIPTVSITPAISSICIGSSQTLTGLSSVIGTSYSWSTGELTNSITLSPTTTSIITVTGVANGCTNTASATINVNPIPTSSFTFNSPVCQGEDASISYTGSASPSATYTWNFGGGVITSGSGQGPYEVHWNTAGTFNITLAVTENGCTSPITSQPITVNPIPLSTFTASSPICVYNSSNIIYTGGASINASYYWNFAGATVLSGSGQGPFQIQWDTPGTYDISLTVSENNCTSIVTNKTVVVYPKPTSTFQVQTPVCVNEPSQIVYTGTASSTAGYHWNFSGTTATTGANQGPYTATWDTPGTYNVSLYVIENGCYSDSSTMQVEVMPLPLVAFSANPTAGCIPVSVQFTDISPDATSWTWNFGDPTSGSNSSLVQNPTHVYNEANSYNVSLTIEGSNGCVNSLTNNSMITGYPLPQAEFYNLPEVGSLENSNITFYPSGSSSNIVAWSWDFGDFYTSDNYSNLESPSHTYQHTGNYTITLLAETEYGCKDSVQKTILIREDFAIYIPNAFTPNGDFANETFGPQGVGYDENYYKLEIYDRWGELVFSTTDITKHWDGKFQGKTSKQDVYNWVIDIKEKDGIKHHFTGVVTLIL